MVLIHVSHVFELQVDTKFKAVDLAVFSTLLEKCVNNS